MMEQTVMPRPLAGTLPAIASKSDAHRLLICAALADGPTQVGLRSLSQDMEYTMGCLKALGASIQPAGPGLWQVSPGPLPPACLLDCGESGSTLRFLLPVAAALGARARFAGHGRLPQRPMGPLVEQLEGHGISFSAPSLPFSIRGRLAGGEFQLPGDVSSQFITGLLLAAPLLPGGAVIRLTSPMESADYIRITQAAMARFGVAVEVLEDGWRVPPGQRYRSPGAVEAEGDWSNAAFWLCAGALGKPVTVTGLRLDSPQGDRAVLDVLARFGARVEAAAGQATVSPGPLRGIAIDAGPIPDLIPVLSVVAACAQGWTEICHAGRLRLKESDRLAAIAAMLRALGAQVEEGSDSLRILGGPLAGGRVDSCADHRMVMAAAIAAIRCQGPVTIDGAQAAAKSYPTFWQDHQRLGGICHGIPIRP